MTASTDVKHVAILGSLKDRAVIKLVMVPEGQSLDFDKGPGATRKWLWPHLKGGWHLVEFVEFEKFSKLAWHTANRVEDLT